MTDKQLQGLREMCEVNLKEHRDSTKLTMFLWSEGFHCGAVSAYTAVLSWLDNQTKKSEGKLQLGDRVHSTINPTYEYTVIGLCDAEGLAQVRSALGAIGSTQDPNAWRTFYQPVHVCSQDILEVVEK